MRKNNEGSGKTRRSLSRYGLRVSTDPHISVETERRRLFSFRSVGQNEILQEMSNAAVWPRAGCEDCSAW